MTLREDNKQMVLTISKRDYEMLECLAKKHGFSASKQALYLLLPALRKELEFYQVVMKTIGHERQTNDEP
jgi:hypothetical protein